MGEDWYVRVFFYLLGEVLVVRSLVEFFIGFFRDGVRGGGYRLT